MPETVTIQSGIAGGGATGAERLAGEGRSAANTELAPQKANAPQAAAAMMNWRDENFKTHPSNLVYRSSSGKALGIAPKGIRGRIAAGVVFLQQSGDDVGRG
jgi:uncharacterized protein YdhG (YjbR/CyaY superfamily)